MVKFKEADIRKFRGVFVCRVCKTKSRGPNIKILSGKISCKKCGKRAFRPVRKK